MNGEQQSAFTPHIGKVCIVRTYASGVFMATVVKQDGRMVELENCRRLWSWKAAEGISLSAVAMNGVDPKGCNFPQAVPSQTVLDALEIIPASEACVNTVNATPVAEAS
jgi:hypothetical protein